MKKFILASTLTGSLLFSGNALAANYTVKSGDSLWKIAKANNVSVANLKSWNNLTSDDIYPGQTLIINSSFSSSTSSSYTVKLGDSLWKIAQANNVSVANLKSWNNLTSDNIYPGQTLIINSSFSGSGSSSSSSSNSSSGSSSDSSSSNSTSKYTVVTGDSFATIAKKFNISITTLQSLNPQINNINLIYVGQVINVPSNAGTTSTSSWEKQADDIITTAKKYIGADYVYGASSTQTNAFDCSSFTQRVFKENGITLPRTTGEQAKMGQTVSVSNMRKGDLIFFDTTGDGNINHVGIAINSSSMIHCGTSTGVTISSLNSYWSPRITKVTRVF